MVGVYFSGTGNTKYCLQAFVNEIDGTAQSYSIEDKEALNAIQKHELIILAYPVYYSNLPKIVRDFIVSNHEVFTGKSIFIIATMGLFSGDGAGCAARLLSKYDAKIIGGLHVKMPDCIGDEKVLKKSLKQNKLIVKAAQVKIKDAAQKFKNDSLTQEGIGVLYHLAGLFGQRLWFYNKTKNYSDKLKINVNQCVGCGKCAQLCPLDNIKIADGKALAGGKCTMCYRCVSNCPKQAITLLGGTLYEQCKIEKYL